MFVLLIHYGFVMNDQACDLSENMKNLKGTLDIFLSSQGKVKVYIELLVKIETHLKVLVKNKLRTLCLVLDSKHFLLSKFFFPNTLESYMLYSSL